MSPVELIDSICGRAGMYVLGEDRLSGVCNLVVGLSLAPGSPFGEDASDLNGFVNYRLGYPENWWWAVSVHSAFSGRPDALDSLRELLVDFLAELEGHEPGELAQRYAGRMAPDDEPRARLRQFLAALPSGDEASLRPLVLPSEFVHELWATDGYPSGVAGQLAGLWAAGRIGDAAPADSGRRRLVCSSLPWPVDLAKVGGEWRVDARPFVAMRRGSNVGEPASTGADVDGLGRVVALAVLGATEAVRTGELGIDEATHLLLRPRVMRQLTAAGVGQEIVDLVHSGSELEDLESLLPERVGPALASLAAEARACLVGRPQYGYGGDWLLCSFAGSPNEPTGSR